MCLLPIFFNFYIFIPGGICLIIITWKNIFFAERQISDNILLVTVSVCVICMWVMVIKVKLTIRDRKNMARQVDLELISTEDDFGKKTDCVDSFEYETV